jgi:hypothetical protein
VAIEVLDSKSSQGPKEFSNEVFGFDPTYNILDLYLQIQYT